MRHDHAGRPVVALAIAGRRVGGRPGRGAELPPERLGDRALRRPKQIHIIDPQSHRKLIQGNDRWIATASFKAADVLLAKPRHFSELLLR